MSWLTSTRTKKGVVTWWVRDIRNGRQVSIAASSKEEAELKREQYNIRRDLEKEGYDDKYELIADEIFGARKGA